MTHFTTKNSTYEVDFENNLIRRLNGENPPVAPFSNDGDWKNFEAIRGLSEGGHAAIFFPGDPTVITTSRISLVVGDVPDDSR